MAGRALHPLDGLQERCLPELAHHLLAPRLREMPRAAHFMASVCYQPLCALGCLVGMENAVLTALVLPLVPGPGGKNTPAGKPHVLVTCAPQSCGTLAFSTTASQGLAPARFSLNLDNGEGTSCPLSHSAGPAAQTSLHSAGFILHPATGDDKTSLT